MGPSRKLWISIIALVGLVSAACGSTVPRAQQEALEATQLGAQGGGLPEGATINEEGEVVNAKGEVIGDAEDFGLAAGGGSTSSTGTVSTSSGSTGTGTTTPSASGGSTPSGKNGPGVTAETVKIGVTYSDDMEEANAAIGAAGATQINSRRAWEAMLNYVNKQGGVNGRKLVPVFHRISATSTEPYEQQDQEACAHWTEDEPVFVTDGGIKTDNGVACFQENGMVSVAFNGLRYKSKSHFARFPTYMEFDGIDTDSIATMYAANMKQMGFFNQGYKLGIVTFDDPEYANPTKNTLVPALKKLGIQVADVTYIATPDSGGEAGSAVAQAGNTAVRYKGDNITHVMFIDAGAQLAFFFMQAAQRQLYAPRYGLTSASGLTALADLLASGGNTADAREQLHDSVAVGWVPTIDVRPADAPSWANPKSKAICYKQMREGGIEMDSANARGLAEGVCDSVWAIQATLEAAGPVLNQETWYQGLSKIGALQLTGGMGFRVSATRRDAIEYAIRAKFIDACTCFRYVGQRFRVPE